MRQWVVTAAAVVVLGGCDATQPAPVDAPTASTEARQDQGASAARDAVAAPQRAASERPRSLQRLPSPGRPATDDAEPAMTDAAAREARQARVAAEQATLDRLHRQHQRTLSQRPSQADFEREMIEDRDEH